MNLLICTVTKILLLMTQNCQHFDTIRNNNTNGKQTFYDLAKRAS